MQKCLGWGAQWLEKKTERIDKLRRDWKYWKKKEDWKPKKEEKIKGLTVQSNE